MSTRVSSTRAAGRRLPVLLGLALALVAAGTPARLAAQAPADARWLPWMGCWEALPGPAQPAPAARTLTCVHASAGSPGVTISTVAGGKVTADRQLVADGAQHAVSEGGCRGWETAAFSSDGHRVFRRGQLECDGGSRRTTSGVMAILPNDRWLDVQGAGATANAGVRVQRYRAVHPTDPAAVALLPVGEDLAIETGRTSASAALLPTDVIEATARLQPRVLQALVFERGNGYYLDAGTVKQLAAARVPTDVIDLMVALSYPGLFTVDRSAATVALRDNPSGGSGGGDRGRGPGGWGCSSVYDSYYGSPYGWGFPAYIYSSYYRPYGYGYYDPCSPWGGYGPYGGYYGPYGGYYGGGYYGGVVVTRGTRSTGGKVVNGGGYSAPAGSGSTGRTAHPRSGGSGSGSASGSTRPSVSPGGWSSGSGGGSGSGSGGGSSSGGSSSGGRTAHPKG